MNQSHSHKPFTCVHTCREQLALLPVSTCKFYYSLYCRLNDYYYQNALFMSSNHLFKLLGAMHSTLTVSYTHLDVYKRQAFISIISSRQCMLLSVRKLTTGFHHFVKSLNYMTSKNSDGHLCLCFVFINTLQVSTLLLKYRLQLIFPISTGNSYFYFPKLSQFARTVVCTKRCNTFLA